MKTWKRKNATDKKISFFLKYFLSYLLMFFIPLFLAFFTYSTASRIIYAQCSEHIKNNLKQACNISDIRLQELKSIPLTLKTNENIIRFHQEWAQADSQGSIITAYKVSRSIPKYEVINSTLDTIRIYFGKPSCCFLLGSNNAMRYTDKKEFWEEMDMNYSDFHQYLQGRHFYEEFLFLPSSTPYIQNVYYLLNLNNFYQEYYSSVILIKLSNQFLTNLLKDITVNGYGTSFILTEDNQLISYFQGTDSYQLTNENLSFIIQAGQTAKDGSFSFEGHQVNRIRSDLNGWTYYSMIPQSIILEDLTSMRHTIMIATVAVMIVGLLTCYLLTRHQSRPLKKIAEALTSLYEYGYFDSTDQFMFLENAVSTLIDRSSSFQESYDNEILRMLFLGENTLSASFQEKLLHSSIQLEDNLYVTGYLHIHNLKSTLTLSGQVMAGHLKEAWYGEIYPLSIDESNMIFLAVHKKKLADSTFLIYTKEILTSLSTRLLEETNCHIDFFLSEPMRCYQNVHQSYEQCKKLAQNVIKKSDVHVYTPEDLPPYQQIYCYTIDHEIRLIQLIKHGTAEKLGEFLQELYTENFDRLLLSEGMKQDLINAIQKSIQRDLTLYQSDKLISRIFSEINRVNSFDSLRTLLLQLREAIQTHNNNTAKSDSEKIRYSILEYMQLNYANSNLNLQYMCADLGINETTAAKFFQELGSSFSSYLEKVRIEAACAMLSQKELTIKSISEKTGYCSDVSFRRAFKRVLGISPSEFIRRSVLP